MKPEHYSRYLLRRKEYIKVETLQAFLFVAQAILAFDPHFSLRQLRGAIGGAKSPDALSVALRNRLDPDSFMVGIRHHNPHKVRNTIFVSGHRAIHK